MQQRTDRESRRRASGTTTSRRAPAPTATTMQGKKILNWPAEEASKLTLKHNPPPAKRSGCTGSNAGGNNANGDSGSACPQPLRPSATSDGDNRAEQPLHKGLCIPASDIYREPHHVTHTLFATASSQHTKISPSGLRNTLGHGGKNRSFAATSPRAHRVPRRLRETPTPARRPGLPPRDIRFRDDFHRQLPNLIHFVGGLSRNVGVRQR